MDNGLIFPYPSVCDHGESVILTALIVVCVLWDVVGVMRGA